MYKILFEGPYNLCVSLLNLYSETHNKGCIADIADNNSVFANHLAHFCEENNFVLSSKLLLPIDSYTYISEAWHTTSWLDHCISTADGHMALGNMSIKYGVAVTDHIPLAFTVNVGDIPVSNESALNNEFTAKLDWSSLTKDNLLAYYNNTDKLLSHIYICLKKLFCVRMPIVRGLSIRETSVPCMTMWCRPCMMVVNLFIKLTRRTRKLTLDPAGMSM